jgi:uncharacterized protein (TIGR02001 family)
MTSNSKAWLACLLLTTAGTASAEWSTNIGWASDYYFRGIHQKSSSASGGVDFERNGFYAGVWGADVGEQTGDGLEIDGYFGYGGEFGYSAGFTGYYYTGDFDDTYQEVNLSLGYRFMTVDVALGEYENFAGATQDYSFYSFTIAHDGFYAKYGSFDQDFNGAYLEAGYTTTIADVDIGLSALYSDENLVGEATEALIFTIGKTFDIN